jgi:hypothetical protein
VYKQTGRLPQPLAELPTPPEELLYLWIWLCQLQHPMIYTELESWAKLNHRQLALWEIEALATLDRVRANG